MLVDSYTVGRQAFASPQAVLHDSESMSETHPQQASSPRVAMFVLNPCHIDARVRKEAATLGDAGYEVRVFALGNRQFPEGVVDEGSFTIHRLEVSSLYQRALWSLSGVYRRLLAWANASRDWRVALQERVSIVLRAVVTALLWSLVLLSGVAAMSWHGLSVAWARARGRPPPERFGADGTGTRWQPFAVGSPRPVLTKAGRVTRRVGRGTKRRARLVTRRGFLLTYGFARRRLMVFHRPSVISQFWRRSAKAAEAWQPDVCHAHDLNVMPGAARAARHAGARLVYDTHELWRHRNRHGELRPVARMVDAVQEWRLIRRADLIVTVSPSIGEWLQRHYRLHTPVTVLRNLPMRRQPREGPPLRELAGLTDEQVIMYTGRITSGRGLEEAVEALTALPADVVLVLLGYGDDLYGRQLRHRADRCGVRDRVRFVEAVAPDQVPAVASQANVALVAVEPVCLSYRFALPNKLFEAIQAGLPVLASDLPDMRRVVQEHDLGELFQTGRPDEVRDGLKRILAAHDRFAERTAKAAAQLHWSNEAHILLSAYEDLLGVSPVTDRGGPDDSSGLDALDSVEG